MKKNFYVVAIYDKQLDTLTQYEIEAEDEDEALTFAFVNDELDSDNWFYNLGRYITNVIHI